MIGLLFALLFIGLNGFFVAAEFALVKVGTTGISSRVKKGDPRAARASNVVSNLERYLSVTQFGITLASLGLGSIGEPAIEKLVDHAVVAVTGHEPGQVLKVVVIAVAFTLLTFSHVLFGELVPKLAAIQRSESIALSSALPLHVIFLVFRPLLWVLERATKLLLRAMGMSEDAASEGTLSEEEIVGILAANAHRVKDGKARAELVSRVLRFSQRTARHAMVPRVDVASLPIETTGHEAWESLRKNEYSRVLLTEGRSLDEVSGYLYSKDLLLDPEARELPTLRPLKREVLFVPETQSLLDVLRAMQRAHTHIAVVVDEYGGSSGIVTLEDLLEEIVGEIRDESDEEPARVVKVQGQGQTYDVQAGVTMDELRSLGVDPLDGEGAEPVGTVVMERLGRIPRKGDRVDIGGASAEVATMSKRRITQVRVRIAPPAE